MSDRLRLIAFSRPPALAAAFHTGFFAREGLDVEYTRAPGSVRQIRGLLAGEFDVAHTAVDNVFAYVDDEAVDLAIVLVTELGTELRLVARDASDVRALAGTRLGVDAARTGHAFIAYKILALHGVPPGAYAVVPVGGTAERLVALRAGEVDVALLSPPHDEDALASGCRVVAEAARYFPGWPSLSVAVRRAWASAHRGLLVRYVRALLAASRWSAADENRDAVVAALAEDLNGDRSFATLVYERASRAREAPPPPSIEEMRASVRRVLALRGEMTQRDGPSGIELYTDFSYVAEALRS